VDSAANTLGDLGWGSKLVGGILIDYLQISNLDWHLKLAGYFLFFQQQLKVWYLFCSKIVKWWHSIYNLSVISFVCVV